MTCGSVSDMPKCRRAGIDGQKGARRPGALTRTPLSIKGSSSRLCAAPMTAERTVSRDETVCKQGFSPRAGGEAGCPMQRLAGGLRAQSAIARSELCAQRPGGAPFVPEMQVDVVAMRAPSPPAPPPRAAILAGGLTVPFAAIAGSPGARERELRPPVSGWAPAGTPRTHRRNPHIFNQLPRPANGPAGQRGARAAGAPTPACARARSGAPGRTWHRCHVGLAGPRAQPITLAPTWMARPQDVRPSEARGLLISMPQPVRKLGGGRRVGRANGAGVTRQSALLLAPAPPSFPPAAAETPRLPPARRAALLVPPCAAA